MGREPRGVKATLSLPDQEVRVMIREELQRLLQDEAKWLSRERAAKHVDLELSAFKRLKKLYGLPFSKLNAKVVRYWSPDVDAMMIAHRQKPKGGVVMDFPSDALQERHDTRQELEPKKAGAV
jgi:hypothetical protein